ncbi:MAG: hypothetical protein M3460_18490 [Actinomycetota bacterium]|nr:hypothetical protein [Actinomycetota bacterium]
MDDAIADQQPLSGIQVWRRGGAMFYPCHCSLQNLGVDSAEADRLVAMDSASARMTDMRFVRACGIAAPPGAFSCGLSLLRCLLLQAAAATAQSVMAHWDKRAASASPAGLPRQANPPRPTAPPRISPQPLDLVDQCDPTPTPAYHHHLLSHVTSLLAFGCTDLCHDLLSFVVLRSVQ